MKVFDIFKSIGILFTLAIVTDLVTCQGGGMGSGAGGGAGAGAGASMGAGIGGGMNGGMGGESMGQGSGMGHGGPPKIPGRNFHSGNNNQRGFMNVEYPEYTQRKKRSIMTEEPIQQMSKENIPYRNKRYTVLVMPHEQNNPNFKQMQTFNRGNKHVGATKQFGRFEEIFNEKVIVQMRSKRTPPEQIPEEEEFLEMENDSSDDASGSSSSGSDSNEENEQNNTNNYNNNEISKRNRRRAFLNGQNRDFKNDHQSLYKNDMHSIPIMEINKQSIIRKSFGNFVQ